MTPNIGLECGEQLDLDNQDKSNTKRLKRAKVNEGVPSLNSTHAETPASVSVQTQQKILIKQFRTSDQTPVKENIE